MKKSQAPLLTLEEANERIEHYIGSVLEDFNEKFEILFEGKQADREKMDNVISRLGNVERKLDDNIIVTNSVVSDLEVFRTETNKRFNGVDNKLNNLDQRLSGVEINTISS